MSTGSEPNAPVDGSADGRCRYVFIWDAWRKSVCLCLSKHQGREVRIVADRLRDRGIGGAGTE